VTAYRLSERAEEDIIRIYIVGALDFGIEQARRYHQRLSQAFEFLSENPFAGPERSELRPICQIHPVGSHIVIYRVLADGISILRVRHSREDWLSQ